jgi:hypothetical protein
MPAAVPNVAREKLEAGQLSLSFGKLRNEWLIATDPASERSQPSEKMTR